VFDLHFAPIDNVKVCADIVSEMRENSIYV
jgi:hypothetical protein